MIDRWEFIGRLNEFMAGMDHAPTEADIRAFVESMTVEDRTRFLCALLGDTVRGLRPPTSGRTAA